MPPFYIEDDFVLSASGTFREATRAESIRQDVAHMLEEGDYLAEATSQTMMDALKADILTLLAEHPAVASVQSVDLVPDETNKCSISIYVNGDPAAITLKA